MGSGKGKVRFAIGENGKLYSELWTLWHNKSDVYLTSKSFGGRLKLSLHESGVCQYAFTQDFFSANENVFKPGFNDRTWHRWRRGHASPTSAVHAVTIVFASCQEWEDYEPAPDESAVLLPRPPHGYCFEIAVIFVPSPYAQFEPGDEARPIAEFGLPSGEFVSVFAGFNELPADYWDFRKIEGAIVEFGDVTRNADDPDDVQGISTIDLTHDEKGPFIIHSRHNMRLVTVPRGARVPIYRRKRTLIERLRLWLARAH